jgi:hypothetical protein
MGPSPGVFRSPLGVGSAARRALISAQGVPSLAGAHRRAYSALQRRPRMAALLTVLAFIAVILALNFFEFGRGD